MSESRCAKCNRLQGHYEDFHGALIDEAPYFCKECAAIAALEPVGEAALKQIEALLGYDYSFADREFADDARIFIPRLIATIRGHHKSISEAGWESEKEIAQRDWREDQLTKIAEALGCASEWSNLHDHGECALEHIAVLEAARDAAMAENVALKATLEQLGGVAKNIAGERKQFETFVSRVYDAFVELKKGPTT